MGTTALLTSGVQFPDTTVQTTAAECIGIGQTLGANPAGTVIGTTYYNTYDKPMFVWGAVQASSTAGNQGFVLNLVINGATRCISFDYQVGSSATITRTVSGIVPPGDGYQINTAGTTGYSSISLTLYQALYGN
jgi:hypothetical protein